MRAFGLLIVLLLTLAGTARAEPTYSGQGLYIDGGAVEGGTLTVYPGTWTYSGSVSFSYQWFRGTTAIGTGSGYVPTAADVGHSLHAVVTATDDTGSASANSPPTWSAITYAPPRNVVAPRITGTPQVGQTLSAEPGSWQLVGSARGPISFVYQWWACGDAEASCDSIGTGSGFATGPTYTIGPEYAGTRLIGVDVLAQIPDGIGGVTWGLASAQTSGRIAPAPPAPPPPPPRAQSNITAGSTIKGTVTWVVTAPEGTKSVEYFRDREQLHVDETSPFAFSLDTTRFSNGQILIGVAFTTSDNVRHKQTIGNVNINNPVKEAPKPPAPPGGSTPGGSGGNSGGSGGSNPGASLASAPAGVPILRPPTLQPQPLLPGQSLLKIGTFAKSGKIARVGKRWGVAMFVVRRETGEILRSGRVLCVAVAADQRIKSRFKGFYRGAAGCSWKIPQWAQGRPLVGSITVRSNGMKLTKTFSAKVR